MARTLTPVLGRRRQRGAATVELVLATPLLMLVIALGLEIALWIHASHVADAVATQAVEATRVHGGSIRAGETVASDLVNRLGADLLLDPQISVTRTRGHARVEVSATAPSVIPGVRIPVRAQAKAPLEQFQLPSQGPP